MNKWFLSFVIMLIITGFSGFINPQLMVILGIPTFVYGIILFAFWNPDKTKEFANGEDSE